MRRESGQNRAPHIDPRRPGASSTGLPSPNRQITWDRRKSWLPKPPSPPPPEFPHGLDGVAARETVLVPEAVEDALRSVPLLAVAGPIVFQDPIDDSRERTQLWPPRRRASAIPWRHRERQHLTDRLAVYTKHPRGLAGAHPLDMTRPPNPCVQLHPIHPPRLPVRATLTEGYTRSHFGPPQPDRPAASVGDYCSAVLRRRRCRINIRGKVADLASRMGSSARHATECRPHGPFTILAAPDASSSAEQFQRGPVRNRQMVRTGLNRRSLLAPTCFL